MDRKLKEGDRVRMTKIAIDQHLHKVGRLPIEPSSTGVVISILPDNFIRVLRDNRKDIRKYHIKFWELDK